MKLIRIFLVAAMVFALYACGNNEPTKQEADSIKQTAIPQAENVVADEDNDSTQPTSADAPDYILIEAESGTMQGSVHYGNSRKGYSGEGYATGFNQGSGNLWEYKADIPESQYYTIEVMAAAGDYKLNQLTVNGKIVGDIEVQGDTAEFTSSVFEGVYLEKGENTFSIREQWGWIDLDCIKISAGKDAFSDFYTDVSSKLANPNASAKTQRIMDYIVENFGKKVIAGQYTNHGYDTEVEAIFRETGKYPAMRGFDYIFYSPSSEWKPDSETPQILNWAEKGGLVTISWHWFAPINEPKFYTKETSFRLDKAVTDIDIAQMPLDEIKQLYDDGTITEETYMLVHDIDEISKQLQILQEKDITIFWRPLHEASGGWFWWGASGEESFKWLWKLMFTRQTYYSKLNNLIWVYNGQNASWYPGDEYLDIIGTDIYADNHDYNSQKPEFARAASESAAKKVVALTENGVIPDPDLLQSDNVYWSWFNTWCREFIVDSDSGEIVETYTSKDMLKKVMTHDIIITLDELPKFD